MLRSFRRWADRALRCVAPYLFFLAAVAILCSWQHLLHGKCYLHGKTNGMRGSWMDVRASTQGCWGVVNAACTCCTPPKYWTSVYRGEGVSLDGGVYIVVGRI